MTLQPGATPVVAGAELLERALGFTRGALSLVRPHLLDAPTPCTAWRLRDLLEHMDDSLAALHDAAAEGWVDLDPVAQPCEPAASVDEPPVVSSLRRHGCSLLGAWSRLHHDQPVVVGGRPLPASAVALVGALEVSVHGWDVARACGDRRPLPDELAHDLLAHAEVLVTDADRGVRFGPPLPATFDRPPSDRLLALTGRSPDWEP